MDSIFQSLGRTKWGLQAFCPMNVEEEEMEAYRRVTFMLKWFALQGMRYVERVMAAWG